MNRPIIALGCVLFLMARTVCPAATEDMVSRDLTMMKQRLEHAVGGMWELKGDNMLRGREPKDGSEWACTIVPNPGMSHAGFEAAQEIGCLWSSVQHVFAYNDFYLLIAMPSNEAPSFREIEENLNMASLDTPKEFRAFVSEQCDCSWDEKGFMLKRNAVASPRFGVYLVEKTADDLEKAELAPRPVLSEADIVSYDWKTHTMEITDAAQKRLEGLLPLVGVHGKLFVVVADGERCYLGGFWSGFSSAWPRHPMVVLDTPTHAHSLVVAKGQGADPRSDARILKTLTELNKLKIPGVSDVMIQYTHAGLTGVKVGRGALHFSWHTGRRPFDEGDSSPMRQSLEAYDSHTVHIWLTKKEVEAFAKWVENNRILDLEAEYPEPEEKTYASAFESSLFVALGKKKYSLSWTDDTKVPDSLHKAVRELTGICQGIRKSRDRSRDDTSLPMGRLGHPLGTYLTIEGIRMERGRLADRTLRVDTVNGRKLASPVEIAVENPNSNLASAGLPQEGARCVLNGYETGKMIGVPDSVVEAEGIPMTQAAWQFHRYFIITTVVEPKSLEKE